jgi:uncharacterized protein YbaP (TraB family)
MRSVLRHILAIVCVAAATLTACAPLAAPSGPALWRLSDSDSEIWLFGTVHILPPTLKWENERIKAAFNAADTIYFEIPLDAPSTAEIAQLVARYGYNKPGVTLSNQLNAEDRARLSVAEAVAEGQASQAGVDQVLNRDAAAQHKKRAYFETPEQQIRFFADLRPDAEIQFLRSTLREIEQGKNEVNILDDAWAHGDQRTLIRDLQGMVREAGPAIYAALIRDRNARWADEIDNMMKGSGKIFIAVGAAHERL